MTVEGDGLDRRLRPQRPAGPRSDQRALRRDRLGRLQRLPLPVRHRRAAQRRLGAARRRAGARRARWSTCAIRGPAWAARPSCSRACWSSCSRSSATSCPSGSRRPRAGRAATSCSPACTRDTGQYYTNYHLEGMGWGGRATTDGNHAQIVPHGNCRNTPIEVLETRYPWINELYRLNDDCGGAGRQRGGLGITRVMTVNADEIVVNAFTDRSRVQPWGLFGGDPGSCGAFLVKRGGEGEWQYFTEAFGTPSDTKFSNVRLRPRRPGAAAHAVGRRLRRSAGAVARPGGRGRPRGLRVGRAGRGALRRGGGRLRRGRRRRRRGRGGEADDAVDHPQRALAPHRRALLRRHRPAAAAPLLDASSSTAAPTTSWTSTARRSCATTSRRAATPAAPPRRRRAAAPEASTRACGTAPGRAPGRAGPGPR